MTAQRVRIEQGIAQGWSAREVAARVGVSVDLVHEVWDELDAAAGSVDAPKGVAESPAAPVEAPVPVHSPAARGGTPTAPEWFVEFRSAVLALGSIELACLDLGVAVRAAEQRWRRHHPQDPMHARLVREVARQARLLRALAAERGSVAA